MPPLFGSDLPGALPQKWHGALLLAIDNGLHLIFGGSPRFGPRIYQQLATDGVFEVGIQALLELNSGL